ncbi:MAG: FAD-dependent oxidoreductase, partial [Alphaproteobacteria bacterium]
MERIADIVIAGGGLGGLCAALAAARRGAGVLVLEAGEGRAAG